MEGDAGFTLPTTTHNPTPKWAVDPDHSADGEGLLSARPKASALVVQLPAAQQKPAPTLTIKPADPLNGDDIEGVESPIVIQDSEAAEINVTVSRPATPQDPLPLEQTDGVFESLKPDSKTRLSPLDPLAAELGVEGVLATGATPKEESSTLSAATSTAMLSTQGIAIASTTEKPIVLSPVDPTNSSVIEGEILLTSAKSAKLTFLNKKKRF